MNKRGKKQSYPKLSEWAIEKRRASTFGFLDVLAFVIPATGFIEVTIIGRLFATEMLLVAIIPLLILSRKNREVKFVVKFHRKFLLLAGIWFFSQMITDIVRETPFHDWSRGWAKILFTMLNFWSLWMLLDGRWRRIVLFSAGIALGDILTYFLNKSEYAFFYPWKFGYGSAVSMSILLLATATYTKRFSQRILTFILLSSIGLVNFIMGFRSLGGILFLTAFFLASHSFINKSNMNVQFLSRQKFISFIIIVSLGGLAVFGLYGALAEKGFLGEKARELYERQSAGEYGVLIGGRSEILAAAFAIKDSPILGHGSWAKDCQYTDILMEMKRRLGYIPGAEDDDCLIPSHSVIMGTWVEAGVLGAILWLWVGFVTVKTLIAVFQKDVKLAPLIVFYAFTLLWHILFSPFAGFMRYIIPFHFATLIIALNWIQKDIKPKKYRS